jgi:hypothetical protein
MHKYSVLSNKSGCVDDHQNQLQFYYDGPNLATPIS